MTVLIVSHGCERKSTAPHESTFGAFFLGILLLQNGSWIRSSQGSKCIFSDLGILIKGIC